jgi:hypothetical protein
VFRKVLLGAIALLFAYIVVRGALLARYEPVTSDSYLWGALHVHSTMSDGLSSLDAIAAAARAARVDFIMMSDHGKPHPRASLIDTTIEGVRFIGGSEVGVPEGHLIVSGANALPLYHLPPFPPDAIAEAHEWGALAIVTYPEDPEQRWSYWENDLVPDGIEIINVTSYFRASSVLDRLDWAVFSMFQPLYYINAISRPSYALDRWDELLSRGHVSPFYATNAHGGFPITSERFLRVPSYETAFGYVGLGVGREYADDPMRAIRSGDFFTLVRGAGEPHRFDFSAHVDGARRGGGSVVPLGSTLSVGLDVGALRPRVVVKRNGAVLRNADGAIEVTADEPGWYRTEIYLDGHPLLADDVPWILSNAIFVGEPPEPIEVSAGECSAIDPLPLEDLKVEMDADSTARLEHRPADGVALDYEIAESTEEIVDRWVALALRKDLDLAGSTGVVVEASSHEPMRYWIEIHQREHGYYASFKTTPGEPQATFLPWSRFYRHFGGRESPDLSAIHAIFVVVNTTNSRTGFESSLELHGIGLCRVTHSDNKTAE